MNKVDRFFEQLRFNPIKWDISEIYSFMIVVFMLASAENKNLCLDVVLAYFLTVYTAGALRKIGDKL